MSDKRGMSALYHVVHFICGRQGHSFDVIL